MTQSQGTPFRGAIGGAANEAGAEYRRGVAAYFVAHGLNGIPVEGLPVAGGDARVEAVALEVDYPVDDVLVSLRRGRLFIQAKHALNWQLIPTIAAQWIAAVRDPQFEPDNDFLLAVAGSLSGPVRSAAQALRRAREGATSYTSAEKDALERLRQVLYDGHASSNEVDRIIESAVVLQMNVMEPGEEEATHGRLLLDGRVVAAGEGTRAWRELLAIAGETARLRGGHTIERWLRRLRERGVSLVRDAHASRASYAAAKQDAVARYRELLIRRGSNVDLSSLGIPVPPISFDEMDADVELMRQDNDRDRLDPLWTMRRYGRIVVTGLPGGGKSTTVARIAGEWAARADWSIPILTSLRRVAEKESFRQLPLRDSIIDMAVATLPPADRPLVAEALHEALHDGSALLLLDGLDEAADRSLLVVADIAEMLREVHPDTDVLVATRDIAYTDARRLEFANLRLSPPHDVSQLVAAVLKAIASVGDVQPADPWVATRKEWVRRVLDADSALRETPLFPVLLASIAGYATDEELPQTRSLILERVVRDVVKRRETTRTVVLAGIDQSHHAAALLGAFPLIAACILEEGGAASRARLVQHVAVYLRYEWGLAPGAATASAEQVLLFWDEAGVFVAGGSEKLVAPRAQLLLDVGVALYVSALRPDDASVWVRDWAQRPEAREALVLAAGKSPLIGDLLIDVGCERNDEALIMAAARALGDGGGASEVARRRLFQKLHEYTTQGDQNGWNAFRVLSGLTIPADLQEAVLETIDACYPAPYPAIARAHACQQWGREPTRLDGYLEAVLTHDRPALPSSATGRGFNIGALTDQIEQRVLENAAVILLPRRPDLAPAAAAALNRASMRTADVIARELRRSGHAELADGRLAKSVALRQQFMAGAQETEKQIGELLIMLRSGASEASLTLKQQRQLPELASLIATLDLNSIDAWPRGSEMMASWPQFVDAVTLLGGFDPHVLAAEAAILEAERQAEEYGGNRPFWSLVDLQPSAALGHWERVPDANGTRELMLNVLRTGGQAAGATAAEALARHPDKAGTAAAVKNVIDEGRASAIAQAVWVFLTLADDREAAAWQLAASQSTAVRRAVARLVAPVTEEGVSAVSRALADDPARQVRLAVLKHFDSGGEDGEAVRTLVERIAEIPESDFVCEYCGMENPASADSCGRCHVVTERPSKVARRLLKTVG